MKLYKVIRLFMLIFLIDTGSNTFAQKNDIAIKLSKQDSLKIKIYSDSMLSAPLYSEKRKRYRDSAFALIPQSVASLKIKAMLLFKRKKYELGMLLLDSAVKYDKTTDCLTYRAFIKCIFQKSYRESLKDFKKVIQSNGNSYVMDHPYEFYMGLCYLQLNEYNKARQLFLSCVEKDRNERGEAWVNPSHWFYLGVTLYEQRDYAKAISCFNSCLKLYPGFSDAEYYKAQCLAQSNELKLALTLLLEADNDYKQGRTIGETNTMYETYPYQINKYNLEGFLKNLNAAQVK